MKQLIEEPNNKININDFSPFFKADIGEKLKPIGLLLKEDGSKSFLAQKEYVSPVVNHLSADGIEYGNSYARSLSKASVLHYLKNKLNSGYWEIFVFEDSKELLKWLAI